MKIIIVIVIGLAATSANAQANFCQYNMPYQPASCYQQVAPAPQTPAPNPQNYMPVYQQPQFQVQPDTKAPGYLPGQWNYQQQQAQLNAKLCQQGNTSYC